MPDEDRMAGTAHDDADGPTSRTGGALAHVDAVDRNTMLAADRTVFAAERTYAAWVRTGLTSLASGIGAHTLLDGVVPVWMAGATGTVLILFSCFCFVAAVWRELHPDLRDLHPEARRLPAWLLVLVNGFLAVVAFTAIAGLWIAS